MRTDKPAPHTRIIVQTDGTVYTIGPRGGTRWVASLRPFDLRNLAVDATRSADYLTDIRRAIAQIVTGR